MSPRRFPILFWGAELCVKIDSLSIITTWGSAVFDSLIRYSKRTVQICLGFSRYMHDDDAIWQYNIDNIIASKISFLLQSLWNGTERTEVAISLRLLLDVIVTVVELHPYIVDPTRALFGKRVSSSSIVPLLLTEGSRVALCWFVFLLNSEDLRSLIAWFCFFLIRSVWDFRLFAFTRPSNLLLRSSQR